MKAFLKKHLIDLLLTILLVLGLWYLDGPVMTLEQWDYVATAGWSMLPVVACGVLVALCGSLVKGSKAKRQYWEAQAGNADADMWYTRHSTKAVIDQNKANQEYANRRG